MNRFHLLSFDEKEAAVPEPSVAKEPHHSATESPAKKDKIAAGSKKEIGKNDRKSRNPRRGETEKHQTVGKGSWGKTNEKDTVDDGEDGTNEAEGPVANDPATESPTGEAAPVEVVPVRPSYKTVKDYLAEQEESKKKLAARAVFNQRKANEGVELEENGEVFKKEDGALVVGKNKSYSSKKAPVAKESPARFSLQELNKLVPGSSTPSSTPRENRPYRERNGNSSPRSGDRRPRQEGQNNTNSYNRDGDNSTNRRLPEEGDNSSNRDGGRFNERRFPREGNRDDRPSGTPRQNGPRVNIRDESAFPALV